MQRLWNRLVGRPGQKSPGQKTRQRGSRRHRRRRLRTEPLESRQLLAANLFHNVDIPEDVSQDGLVTPFDALTIINQISERQQDSIEQGEANGNVSGPDDRTRERPRGRLTDVNNDGQDTAIDALMVINRISRDQERLRVAQAETDRQQRPVPIVNQPTDTRSDAVDSDQDSGTEDGVIVIDSSEVRSIDGSNNNLEHSDFGATNTQLLRIAENDYADGTSEPAGEDRPSAREISNLLSAADPAGTTSGRDLSSFVFAWGQFLDHDIDLSLEPANEADSVAFDIEVPEGDPLFDPFGTGEATIHLTRSAIADGTGTSIDNPAEQVNAITAWVDGSQVYGSDQETSDSLREFVGGRLLISSEGLLPTDENGGLLAGDIRAAENVVLTSMHALFVREHNRLADEIASGNPDLSDEEIFQQARATVIAQLQSITYNDYLPALLGEDALAEYAGYDSSVDPTIANEFSTAAFRFGHSTLNDEFRVVGNDGDDVDDPVALAGAFFQPEILEETGIEPFLKYASSTLSQEVDLEVVDSLRNFLFGPPGSGGLDLVSLNIQRGRDHGLADYNSTREAYGLERVETFADITSNVDVQTNLETLYGSVDNVDLWVGLMAEDAADGGSLGETSTLIIADQFERLRDGDRFYYANSMSDQEVREIENTSLADIIERNTSIESLQDDVFFFEPTISGRVVVDRGEAANGTANQSDAIDSALGEAVDAFAEFQPVATADVDLLAEDRNRLARGQQQAGGSSAADEGQRPNQLSPDGLRGDDGQVNQGPSDQTRTDGARPNLDPRNVERPDRDPSNVAVDLDAVAGLTVELLDAEGNVVDQTVTDERGGYRFDDFDQSGWYTIRLLASEEMEILGSEIQDVLVNDDDDRGERFDFHVTV